MSGRFSIPVPSHMSFASYLAGLVLSLVFTLSAYFLVSQRLLPDAALLAAIVGLALLQLGAQLVFFFHLGREERPYWNALAFLFMAVVTLILVAGSLWIMFTLDDRVMPMKNGELLHRAQA